MSGLNPNKFGPPSAQPSAPSGGNSGGFRQMSGDAAPEGQRLPPKSGGQVKAELAGTYEYVRPGSFEKSTQTLVLRADGTCSYSEEGQTSMETFSMSGDGTWDVCDAVVRIVIGTLTRDNKFKVKPLVKDITEGRSYENNVNIPITEAELAKAPGHGTNKWRRK